eukprot:TRINITY_DN59001_c0_g1_i3.p1 TRINITY_DN59001_c0_g1~~TRINITY_DN59001_c0_g1_i3.p1  ORF type:complete len:427 (-),score=11.53 TRINITY_DN59001_c0_g1_i3:862-2142(-)
MWQQKCIIETKSLSFLVLVIVLFSQFQECISHRHLSQSWLLRDICTFNNYEETDYVCETSEEIIGGLDADPLRFPYLISLQSPNNRVGLGCFFHFCGASLIAPDFVLTAAHCIYDVVGQAAPSSGKMGPQVYAALSPKCRHMGNNGRAKVTDYWYHPEYSSTSIENDIALLKLDRPLSSNGPFLEYRPRHSGKLPYDTKVTVAGWGDINPSENNQRTYNLRKLMRGDLTVLSWRECQAVMATFTSRNVNEDIMLCAYSRDTDSCAGDSGGPLIVTDDSSNLGDYTKDYQAGIVSWGPGQACVSETTRFPGVYTRISAYTNWIDGIVSVNSDSPLLQLLDTPNILVNSFGQSTIPEPQGCITQGGCKCQADWEYNGVGAQNCGNPDNDPVGSWCIVESSGIASLCLQFLELESIGIDVTVRSKRILQ